jgi:hypothetical protein
VQRVLVGGLRSELVPVTSGVPQGSVLGPALFTLFINDIVECVTHSTIRLFADDTLLYCPVTKPDDATNLQNDLDRLYQWSKTNGMKFNAKKSNTIVFSKSHSPHSDRPVYKLGDTDLQYSNNIKYLGVQLSEDMKWNTHVKCVLSKASMCLGLIKHTLHKAPSSVKLVAYKTLCRPVLEYAAEVWDPCVAYLSEDLEMVQNRAIRFILELKGRDVSITSSREHLDMKTLKKRRQEHRHSLFIKILQNDQSFPSLTETFAEMQSESVTRAGHRAISCNTDQYLRSFLPNTAREIRRGDFLPNFSSK